MRKIITIALSLLVVSSVFGQRANQVAPGQLNEKATYDAKLQQILKDSEVRMPEAVDVVPLDYKGKAALKTSAVTPIAIGRASNVYSHLRQEQNNIYADNDLNMIMYIHRQDVAIHGGGGSANGKLRYDISIDGGVTWVSDLGILNATYTRPARYPNITGYNADSSNTDPLSSNYFYCAPTLDQSPDWDGHVTGYGSVVNSGTLSNTENYDFAGQNTLLPGGLTEGMPGEFWAVDAAYNTGDFIFVHKGVYNDNTTDVDWTRKDTLDPPHNLSTGSAAIVGPNIAFSPDGMTGYVVWLGDLIGGNDSVLSPCYYKSTDGGATWDSVPTEINMNANPWVADTLQSFWINIDTLTGDTIPAGSGKATTGFDFDVTVDANGNLHVGVVVGNGPVDAAYSISSGIVKFMADVYTPDGGSTWDVSYMGPVLAFRGEFGVPDDQGNLLSMDNVCQVSRNDDGTRIFFSWVDSDTTVIGFGESANLAPNLRIASKRITDNTQTCWKRISDGDAIWDGKILFPQMAPEVITAASGNRHYLPIVYFEMLNNDQLGATQFQYIGNDAQILESEYVDPTTLNLAFNSPSCYPVFTGTNPIDQAQVSLTSFPNPTSGDATVRIDLVNNTNIDLDLVNMMGRKVMDVAAGSFNAGRHDLHLNTADLANGVYFYTLRAGDKVYTNKLVVSK